MCCNLVWWVFVLNRVFLEYRVKSCLLPQVSVLLPQYTSIYTVYQTQSELKYTGKSYSGRE